MNRPETNRPTAQPTDRLTEDEFAKFPPYECSPFLALSSNTIMLDKPTKIARLDQTETLTPNDLRKTEGPTDRLTEDRPIDRTQKPINHDFFTAVPHIEALFLSSLSQFLWGPKKDIIDKDRSTEGPTGRPTDRSTEDRPIDRSIKVHGNSMQMPKTDISIQPLSLHYPSPQQLQPSGLLPDSSL